MRESDIEHHLVNCVKRAGGAIRKAQWIGRRGCPDRYVMLPWCAPFWVELKRPGEKPEAHQKHEHREMRALNATVLVIDSIKQIDDLFTGRI